MLIIKRWIFVFALFSLIVCCTSIPDVRFLEPQPINKKDLKSFPRKFQGQYLNKTDSSILTIDSEVIFQEWEDYSKLSNIEMETIFDSIYSNDTELQLENNWILKIDVENDSSMIYSYRIDTLFEINVNQSLRALKGYLFLNDRRVDSTWRVKIVHLEHGELEINELIKHSEIDSLREITQIASEVDSISNEIEYHNLNPKKKELKEILKRRNAISEFVKIK